MVCKIPRTHVEIQVLVENPRDWNEDHDGANEQVPHLR